MAQNNPPQSSHPVTLALAKIENLGRSAAKEGRTELGAVAIWEHEIRWTKDLAHVDQARTPLNWIAGLETAWELHPWNTTEPGCERMYHPSYLRHRYHEMKEQLKVQYESTETTYLIEIIFSFSPVWFRDGNLQNPLNSEKVKAWRTSTHDFVLRTFTEKEFGLPTAVVVHEDETTPHYDLIVFPVTLKRVKQRGRLPAGVPESERPATEAYVFSASSIFTPDKLDENGKTKAYGTISVLRDKYADHLKKAGIEAHRGLHNPKVVKQHLRESEKPSPDDLPILHQIDLPEVERGFAGLRESAECYRQRVQLYVDSIRGDDWSKIRELQLKAAESVKAQERANGYYQTAFEKDREIEQIKEQLQVTRTALEQMTTKLQAYQKIETQRKQVTPTSMSFVSIFLTQVLGLVPNLDGDGSSVFTLPPAGALRISASNATWTYVDEHDVEHEGKTLLMLMQKCGLVPIEEAMLWVNDRVGPNALQVELEHIVADQRQKLTGTNPYTPSVLRQILEPDRSQWEAMRANLIQLFGLAPARIDALRDAGILAANENGHLLWQEPQMPTRICQQFDEKFNRVFWPSSSGGSIRVSDAAGADEAILCFSPLEALLLDRYKSLVGLGNARVFAVPWHLCAQADPKQTLKTPIPTLWIANSGYSKNWRTVQFEGPRNFHELDLPPQFSDWVQFIRHLWNPRETNHLSAKQGLQVVKLNIETLKIAQR